MSSDKSRMLQVSVLLTLIVLCACDSNLTPTRKVGSDVQAQSDIQRIIGKFRSDMRKNAPSLSREGRLVPISFRQVTVDGLTSRVYIVKIGTRDGVKLGANYAHVRMAVVWGRRKNNDELQGYEDGETSTSVINYMAAAGPRTRRRDESQNPLAPVKPASVLSRILVNIVRKKFTAREPGFADSEIQVYSYRTQTNTRDRGFNFFIKIGLQDASSPEKFVHLRVFITAFRDRVEFQGYKLHETMDSPIEYFDHDRALRAVSSSATLSFEPIAALAMASWISIMYCSLD